MIGIQGFGKGSGRHSNRCPHCGQFMKRGILYAVEHMNICKEMEVRLVWHSATVENIGGVMEIISRDRAVR